MGRSALSAIGTVAAACMKHPRRPSLWLEAEGRYVCPDEAEAYAQAERMEAKIDAAPSPRIDPKFKLVFLTAASGTLLFTLICVALHLVTTGEPPPARKEFIEGMLTMAKIGFGAIVGLLGGKVL
ncbi:MAG TPA: hypothetical protein VGV87_02550 [Blastocatellia bacterium]|nr:hypothetical protein [Blastocatellia bacterium]